MFKKTGASTVTALAAPGKAVGATSINVGSTTNYPQDTGIIITIRIVDSSGVLVPGTYTEFSATVTSATALAIVATPVYGDDQIYAAGSTTQVFIPVSAAAHNKMVDGIVVEHNQDGTHKNSAITTSLNNNGVLGYGSTDTSQTGITSNVPVTNCSLTVTVPTGGRKVRITAQTRPFSSVSTDICISRLFENVTSLDQHYSVHPSTSVGANVYLTAILTPAAGSHTYYLGVARDTGSGTVTNSCSAEKLSFILVEYLGGN